eukprot:TRINITY_DN13281_c0_g1_i1.p2 TRINITY_DN13281_c0_g1~~TRINITY_DN13281_c0_g1_i1.p2  ORF type:complete len:106 (-),score=18.23 TRINITY_DN13281_c0_g1_i1:9-326(-)
MLKVGILGEIMNTLIDIPQLFADSPDIVNLTMQIFSRYAYYFENHEAQLEVAIKAFTSERGVFADNAEVASKAVLPMYSALILSLIHICRCRRYAVCRSRWSPYH